jgi:glycosyltransferase involved in cell wall biosynthesis
MKIKNSLKIFIVNQHKQLALGGSELQCDIIAKGLKDRGNDVVYIALGSHSIDFSNIPYKIIPFKFSFKKFFYLLRKEKPDIIYWRNRQFRLAAVINAKLMRIPFVFAVSSPDDLKVFWYRIDNPKNYFLTQLLKARQLVKSFYNYFGLLLSDGVTSLNSKYLEKVPIKNKVTVWNAMENDSIPFSWPRPYFLWVSNIKPIKRPEIYLKLAQKLSEENLDVDFLMVGSIKSDHYRLLIHETETTANFHYLGLKTPNEVNGILKNSIALIHTCLPEGFGNNFIQAWHSGCPTITYEFDPENLIRGEQLGFVADNNFDNLVEQTKFMIKNKSERKKMGDRALKFAQSNFFSSRLIDDVETFLYHTLKNY